MNGFGSPVDGCPAETSARAGGAPPLSEAESSEVMALQNRIDAGLDVNAVGPSARTCLLDAAQAGKAHLVALLLECGAQADAADEAGNTAAHAACLEGHERCLALLLQAGAVGASQHALSPLHVACQHGHAGCVRLLLASPGGQSPAREGDTSPLHLAAEEGHLETVQALLEAAGAAPAGCADAQGRLALHLAVRRGHADVAAALLHALPGSVSAPTAKRWTPLMYACRWGHFHVSRWLLQAGADVELASTDGRTPLSVARDGKHQRIVTLLLTAGAREEDSAALATQCAGRRLCGAPWCAGPQ